MGINKQKRKDTLTRGRIRTLVAGQWMSSGSLDKPTPPKLKHPAHPPQQNHPKVKLIVTAKSLAKSPQK